MVTVPPVVSYVSLTPWGEGRREPQDAQEGDSVTSYLCFPSLFQTLYGYFCAKSYEIKRG